MERRLFARTTVEVGGMLHWATARRLGGTKAHSAEITTVDLSVDGAKVLIAKKHALPVGASCRLVFGDQSSPARVLEVLPAHGGLVVLRLNLEHPTRSFMKVIEQWLAVNAGGRKFAGSLWAGEA